MGQYSSSLYYGKYNMRGCYVMGIWDLTDTMYTDRDHDETEKGRKSQSHRPNGGGTGEQGYCENGRCHPCPPPAEAEVAPWLPWSHMDTHQLRTWSSDYSPEDPLMTQGQAPLTTHSCKCCSALFCGSAEEWFRACNVRANSSELLYRWQ